MEGVGEKFRMSERQRVRGTADAAHFARRAQSLSQIKCSRQFQQTLLGEHIKNPPIPRRKERIYISRWLLQIYRISQAISCKTDFRKASRLSQVQHMRFALVMGIKNRFGDSQYAPRL